MRKFYVVKYIKCIFTMQTGFFFKNRGPWLGKTPWGLLSNRKADFVLATPPPKNSLKIVQMFC